MPLPTRIGRDAPGPTSRDPAGTPPTPSPATPPLMPPATPPGASSVAGSATVAGVNPDGASIGAGAVVLEWSGETAGGGGGVGTGVARSTGCDAGLGAGPCGMVTIARVAGISRGGPARTCGGS